MKFRNGDLHPFKVVQTFLFALRQARMPVVVLKGW